MHHASKSFSLVLFLKTRNVKVPLICTKIYLLDNGRIIIAGKKGCFFGGSSLSSDDDKGQTQYD